MQGLVVSAYAHLRCARYHLLQVTDRARARETLHRLAHDVTSADHAQAGWSLNVAFTHQGLRALGLAEDALRTFAPAFRSGMASSRCARVLGDRDANAPCRWAWGGPGQTPVHVLLLLYASREAVLEELVATRAPRTGRGSGLRLVARLDTARQPEDSREHFGFADGIGQPVIAGSGRHDHQIGRTGHATDLAPGEFVLGYPDEEGGCPPTPTVWSTEATRHLAPIAGRPDRRDLGRNGSYLVLRQLRQDVAGFWGAMREHAAQLWPGDRDADTRLAAKLVGRWPSGAPLVLYPDADPVSPAAYGHAAQYPHNDFTYRDPDPHGHRCPIGAHIRRANPRDALGGGGDALRSMRRHRLLRRGRIYGERIADRYADDGADRGLYFICLGADLERQFEFVQQTWLNNPGFADLPGEVDPLAGARDASGASPYSVHADPLRACVARLGSYVHVRGGAYFFLPGLGALRALTAP